MNSTKLQNIQLFIKHFINAQMEENVCQLESQTVICFAVQNHQISAKAVLFVPFFG